MQQISKAASDIVISHHISDYVAATGRLWLLADKLANRRCQGPPMAFLTQNYIF